MQRALHACWSQGVLLAGCLQLPANYAGAQPEHAVTIWLQLHCLEFDEDIEARGVANCSCVGWLAAGALAVAAPPPPRPGLLRRPTADARHAQAQQRSSSSSASCSNAQQHCSWKPAAVAARQRQCKPLRTTLQQQLGEWFHRRDPCEGGMPRAPSTGLEATCCCWCWCFERCRYVLGIRAVRRQQGGVRNVRARCVHSCVGSKRHAAVHGRWAGGAGWQGLLTGTVLLMWT